MDQLRQDAQWRATLRKDAASFSSQHHLLYPQQEVFWGCDSPVDRVLFQTDFDANTIVCSPLLCCVIRLEHKPYVLLIKVSCHMEVIRRHIPQAPTVIESISPVFVIVLFASVVVFTLEDPFCASTITEITLIAPREYLFNNHGLPVGHRDGYLLPQSIL